jgi:glycosyltransferase involved in cell wall biosynthesis
MRIGFDVSQTGAGRAGCGYVAYSLARALAACAEHDEFVLYPTFGDFFFDPNWHAATYLPDQPNFRRGLAHAEHGAAQRFWARPLRDLDAQLGHPDLVHANNFFCPRGLLHARLVYTLYDLSFLENPDWTVEANRTGCFEGVFRASLHADHIVAISHFSRRHFLDTFPHFPEDRVTVMHLASRFCDALPVQRPAQFERLQPGKFWVCVGTVEPRKNHPRLLQAYARLKARLGTVAPLVLAGGKGWLMDDINRLIAMLGIGDDVIFAGYVDDAALQWLYQNCYAALYPSLFEGFGLPVLEAMSLGAAVVTSDVTSIPEITGDAALMVDPTSEEAICAAMARLVQAPGLRDHLRVLAEAQARRFRWETAAQTAQHCYEQVLLTPPLREVLGANVSGEAAATVVGQAA